MRIEKPGETRGTAKTDSKKPVSGGDRSFGDFLADGPQAQPSVSTAHSIHTLDSLLAVQAAGNTGERAARGRARARAGNILQELEKIRMLLLTGNITVGDVINIADVVASHREQILDPGLTAILDEIDLRAQVELAKMRLALDKVG